MHASTRTLVLALLAAGLVACGKNDSAGVVADSRSQKAPPVAAADQAVTAVLGGLADGRPEVLWQALPASYRRDVTQLVHGAAAEMDAELWNRTFAVVGKLSRVLDEKREFILAHPMVAGQLTNASEAQKSWDAVVGLFDTIVESDLANLEQVRQLDIEQFLASTGGRLMQRLAAASALTADDGWAKQMAALRATKATVVSASGDRAVVRIEVPGTAPREDPYVRVEGQWVPEAMAQSWEAEMAEARERIAALAGDKDPEKRQAVMMQLALADRALDTVLEAGSAEEFNASLGSVFGLALGGLSHAAGTQGAPSFAAEPVAQATEPAPQAMEPVPQAAEPVLQADPAPVAQAEPAAAVSFEPQAIAVADAPRYVGQRLRVEGADGLDFTGQLVEVADGVLRFQKSYGAGTVSIEVRQNEVRSLRLAS